jgi:hypothetical protein
MPSLLRKTVASGAREPAVGSFEFQKQAATLRLFKEHEYRMCELQRYRAPRRYVPPPVKGREVDRLQIEKDSARLMRKLILRPRSHTYE